MATSYLEIARRSSPSPASTRSTSCPCWYARRSSNLGQAEVPGALLTRPLGSHVRSAHTSALFESFSVWGSLMGMQPTRARRPWHRLGRRPSPNRCERHSRQPTSSTLTVRPSPLYLDRPSPCMLARATCHQLAPQAHRHAMNAPCERASACGTLSLASRERALAQTYVPSAAARPCACSAQPGAARARDGELGGRRRLRGAQGEG